MSLSIRQQFVKRILIDRHKNLHEQSLKVDIYSFRNGMSDHNHLQCFSGS